MMSKLTKIHVKIPKLAVSFPKNLDKKSSTRILYHSQFELHVFLILTCPLLKLNQNGQRKPSDREVPQNKRRLHLNVMIFQNCLVYAAL